MPSNTLFSDADDLALLTPEVVSGDESLPVERCLEIHRLMVRARVLEERMIKMSKSGQGYFWIGGPGEEAFNIVLGLQVNKGFGPAYDFLHLHYRNCGIMLAMGMPVIDALRMMVMTATDTHSRGRNFCAHFARRDWNVIPVTSVIEVQYAMAPGTAHVQKRHGGDGITLVIGGEAGTAEGDFASCMIWSSRPGNELPVLMLVTNNGWGISTPACTQHGEERIIDRGKAFGIPGAVVDGNDPIATWHAVDRAMRHCRTTRSPYMLEGLVSRLHGHSSSSGATRVKGEIDPIQLFETRLLDSGVDAITIEQIREDAIAEVEQATEEVLREPAPTAADIERDVYAPSTVDAVYPRDYDGLPRAR